jgi:hypothetical protein
MYDVTPPTFDEGRHETSVIGRDYGRLLDLPAPDPEPKNEEHFAEGRDESEIKIGIRKNVGPEARNHPAQSSDEQHNPQYPRDVAGPVDQVAQENKMNSKDDQGHGPFVMKRMEQKPNLRMQLTGSKDGQVIRCGEEMIMSSKRNTPQRATAAYTNWNHAVSKDSTLLTGASRTYSAQAMMTSPIKLIM